ncbi:MAG: SpaH/EbpB family LPXTG-anchored major pilin [Lachnospiraceae bacterium]|nr:SpaH/EbpB family LPXTG-anchored major pilin [Lachnospiraceae bacterium]
MKHLKFKRIISLFFALVLIVGMMPKVSKAAPTIDTTKTGSLTINKTDEAQQPVAGAGFTIYKVADLKQDGGTMSYDTTGYTHGVIVTGDTTAAAFDTALSQNKLTAVGSEEKTELPSGQVKFSNLSLGIYLVKETTIPAHTIASNNFLVSIPMTDPTNHDSWTYDVVADPKNAVFTGGITKEITSSTTAETGTNSYTANVGEQVTYKITVTMPNDFYGTSQFKKNYNMFKVIDIPSTGLKIDMTSVTAKVGTTNVGTITTGTPQFGTTAASTTDGFTVDLLNSEGTAPQNAAIVAGATVEITYNATITKDAVGQAGVTNAAHILYDTPGSDKPGDITPDPSTPTPTIHTYSHAVLKTDDKNNALNGAEFVVKLNNNKYLQLNTAGDGWNEVDAASDATTFTSGSSYPLASYTADGYFDIIGVKGGDHQLIETKAPAGYTLLTAPVSITFDDTSTTTQGTNHGHTTTVVNAKSFYFPTTGGKGIIIFIGGGALLIALGIFVYSRKRKIQK